jgi:hypothetical protein
MQVFINRFHDLCFIIHLVANGHLKAGLKIMVAWLPVATNQDLACSILALSLGHLYHTESGEPHRKKLRLT